MLRVERTALVQVAQVRGLLHTASKQATACRLHATIRRQSLTVALDIVRVCNLRRDWNTATEQGTAYKAHTHRR